MHTIILQQLDSKSFKIFRSIDGIGKTFATQTKDYSPALYSEWDTQPALDPPTKERSNHAFNPI
jgi:hypothetical protein